MSVIVQKFLTEPVFAIGILVIATTTLVAEDVVTGWVGIVGVAVFTAIQRQLVSPAE